MFPDRIQEALDVYLSNKATIKKQLGFYPPMITALLQLFPGDQSNLYKVYQCTLGAKPERSQTSYMVLQAILKEVSEINFQKVDEVLRHLHSSHCLDEELLEWLRKNSVIVSETAPKVVADVLRQLNKSDLLANIPRQSLQACVDFVTGLVCRKPTSATDILLQLNKMGLLEDQATTVKNLAAINTGNALYITGVLVNLQKANIPRQSLQACFDFVTQYTGSSPHRPESTTTFLDLAAINTTPALINPQEDSNPIQSLQAYVDFFTRHTGFSPHRPESTTKMLYQLNKMGLLEDHTMAVENLASIKTYVNAYDITSVLEELQSARIPATLLQACFDVVIKNDDPKKSVYILCQLNKMGLLRQGGKAFENINAITLTPGLHSPFRAENDRSYRFSGQPTDSCLIYLLGKLEEAKFPVVYLQMIYNVAIERYEKQGHNNDDIAHSCLKLLEAGVLTPSDSSPMIFDMVIAAMDIAYNPAQVVEHICTLQQNGYLDDKDLARVVLCEVNNDDLAQRNSRGVYHILGNREKALWNSLASHLESLKELGALEIVKSYAKRATNPHYIQGAAISLKPLQDAGLIENKESVKVVMEYVVGKDAYVRPWSNELSKSFDVSYALQILTKAGLLKSEAFFQSVIAFLKTCFDPIKATVRIGSSSTGIKLGLSVKSIHTNLQIIAGVLVTLKANGLFNPHLDHRMIFRRVIAYFANMAVSEFDVLMIQAKRSLKFRVLRDLAEPLYKKTSALCMIKSGWIQRMSPKENLEITLPREVALLIASYSVDPSYTILGGLLVCLKCDMEKMLEKQNEIFRTIHEQRVEHLAQMGLQASATKDIRAIIEGVTDRESDATIIGFMAPTIKILTTSLALGALDLSPKIVLGALQQVMSLIIRHNNDDNAQENLNKIRTLYTEFYYDIEGYIKALKQLERRQQPAFCAHAATSIQAGYRGMKARSLLFCDGVNGSSSQRELAAAAARMGE